MSATPRVQAGESRARVLQRGLADRPALILIGILVLVILLTDIVSPGFISGHQFSTTLLNAAPLGVLAAGQTLVMLTGGIDLSIALIATAAAYVMSELASQGTFTAVAVALALGLFIGLVNGIGIGVFGVQPLIMTLGMQGIIVGALTVFSMKFTNGVPLVPDPVRQLGSGTILSYIPVNLLLWAPLSLLIIWGLRRSGFGRMVYAVGDNPVACRLAGIRVWQVLVATYALCGLLAAVAGLLYVGATNAADLALVTPYLLPSIAAAVIGGTSILGGSGGYGGTIIGALILTVLNSLLVLLNASEAFRQILYGVIVLALAWIYARTSGADA